MTTNRACLVSLAAICLMAGPVTAQEYPPYAMTQKPSQDGRCRGDTGTADLDRSEKACLDQLTGIATRQGEILHLTFQNGTARNYENRSTGCDEGKDADCIEYKLTGYFPKHKLLLVQVGYYEGAEWMLIWLDDGKETKIHAPPHYSPHEKWLVSVCASEGPSGCGNGIDIVPTVSDQTLHAWHYRMPDDEYALCDFVGWDSDDRVKLNVTFHANRVWDSGDLKTMPASVDYVGGKWQLELPREYRSRAR